MKLWKLERTGDIGYDEADGFVIAALTPKEARLIASNWAGDEGSCVWTSKSLSTCRTIVVGKRPRVILRSYAGG